MPDSYRKGWVASDGKKGYCHVRRRFPPTRAIVSAHEPRAPHRLRLPREEERRPRARPLAAVGEPAVRACVRQGRAAGARLEGQAEAEVPEDHQGGRGARARRPPSDCWRHGSRSSSRTAPSTPTACSSPSSSTAGSRRPAARCASPATTPTGASAGSTSTRPSARSSPASSRARSSRPTTRRRCAGARRRSRWPRPPSPTTTRCSRPPTTGRSRRSCCWSTRRCASRTRRRCARRRARCGAWGRSRAR